MTSIMCLLKSDKETHPAEIKALAVGSSIPRIKRFGKPRSKDECSNQEGNQQSWQFLFSSLCLGICFYPFWNYLRFTLYQCINRQCNTRNVLYQFLNFFMVSEPSSLQTSLKMGSQVEPSLTIQSFHQCTNFISIKLNISNYLLWRSQVLPLVRSLGLLHHITNAGKPLELVEDQEGTFSPNPEYNA